MSSSYGENLRIHIFGESHGPAVGVTVEGIPAGERVDLEELQRFLDRRAPGRSAWSTPRKEADIPEFLSGLREGRTCGTPLTAILKSANTRSGDYDALRDVPRPGHADYTAWVKYGESRDSRGGGHFSGRLTAPLCVAGGICLQLLAREGITKGVFITGNTVIDAMSTTVRPDFRFSTQLLNELARPVYCFLRRIGVQPLLVFSGSIRAQSHLLGRQADIGAVEAG